MSSVLSDKTSLATTDPVLYQLLVNSLGNSDPALVANSPGFYRNSAILDSLLDEQSKSQLFLQGSRDPLMQFNQYTPNWAAISGTPDVGSGGSLAGKFTVRGGYCTATVELVLGSSPTIGTGAWTFSLPVQGIKGRFFGSGVINDNSSGTYYPIVSSVDASTGNTVILYAVGGTHGVGQSVPLTWAVSDYLYFSITYPTAE